MKTGLSYKQHPVDDNYEVIIVGSGMGALATGAILAKEGKKVLILEKHYTAGGFTHVFKRKNYEWDVGLHYVGSLDKDTRMMKRMFDYVTDGRLQWADMGETYDRILFGKEEYRFVKGVQNWKEQMKTYFPNAADVQAIDAYVDLVFKAASAAWPYFAEKALSPWMSWVAGWFMRSKFLRLSRPTTLEVLQSLTRNKKLIGVLTGQYGDYGLPPAQSSFAMHAMLVKHYFNGGYYPIGGAGKIAESILPVIEAAGGKLYTNAEVTRILVKNQQAIGVKMADGRELLAPVVISDAGFMNTFGRLLPAEITQKIGYQVKLGLLEPSASHISLYLGLPHSAEALRLPKANYWIYPDNYDHDANLKNYESDPEAPLPVVYISFPSAKDPDFQNRYPGRSTIEIIGFAPYPWFQKWEGTRWNKRGSDYEALKEKLIKRLLEHLFNVEPQVKGKIEHAELSTPLSTANFVNYARGEIYGLAHTPRRFQCSFLRPRTPIKNLLLTGQDITTCGIGGAMMAGVLTASALLGRNMMQHILRATEAAA
ncbi:MAG: phytoene dehydrogenase [Chitinophagales bacterium]|nr:MAG: phytoene dehydrogenase [Chitinophagales bacterium]